MIRLTLLIFMAAMILTACPADVEDEAPIPEVEIEETVVEDAPVVEDEEAPVEE
jgi:hypothetical protein